MRHHCDNLKVKEGSPAFGDEKEPVTLETKKHPLPPMGPGAEKDALWHRQDGIPTGYLLEENYRPCASIRKSRSEMEREIEAALARKRKHVTGVATLNEEVFAESEGGDTVEIIEVRNPSGQVV